MSKVGYIFSKNFNIEEKLGQSGLALIRLPALSGGKM